jgi:hypothetical protein
MKIYLVYRDGKYLKHIDKGCRHPQWVDIEQATMFFSYPGANSAGLFTFYYRNGAEKEYEIHEYDLTAAPYSRLAGRSLNPEKRGGRNA